MSTITVIGTGYVGLVTGACLSDFGHSVICVDSDKEKIEMLQQGISPIYEMNLEELIKRNVYYKRLSFTDDIAFGIKHSKVIFIAVGTPALESGIPDMSYYDQVIEEMIPLIEEPKIIVNKSTVPIGTARKYESYINESLRDLDKNFTVDLVSNPEFLREGSAVQNFTIPDRVVIGSESEQTIEVMKDIYRVLYLNETPFIVTDQNTAETIKYATNAFLATKISFINEMANLCDTIGANVQDVAKAMGRDGRISPKFLHAGAGFGGSCFPKDTRAIVSYARERDVSLSVIESVINANERQKAGLALRIKKILGSMENRKIAVLGLSFKPNTDDVREGAALVLIEDLIKMGAKVCATDPEAIGNAKKYFQGSKYEHDVVFLEDEYEAMEDADALVIVTEWNQYRMLDFDRVKEKLRRPIIFDFRNVYKKKAMEFSGIEYYCIGQ